MTKKTILASLLVTILLSVSPLTFAENVNAENFGGWQITDAGGKFTESNGVLTFSGDERALGPKVFREFKPQGDFEIAFQLKAETLGEVIVDQAGEGFGLSVVSNITGPYRGIGVGIRARAGGQFELTWYNKPCEVYGWGCEWVPFVYNGIAYNNGYAFWHPNTPKDRSQAPVQPDRWYTLKLKVKENPFTATGEVYAENGTLIGSLTANDMYGYTFRDLRYVMMASPFGGTFYLKNLTGIGPNSDFSFSPEEPLVGHPVLFVTSQALESNGQKLNYSWNFGDGNTTIVQEQNIIHSFANAGTFNVSLTVTDSMGEKSSTSQIVRARVSTCLSISTDASFSVVGSIVNLHGKLIDAFGTGLANEPVVLQYSFPGTMSWYPISSTITDESGSYAVQWVNPATGSFTLKAEWAGNSTHVSAVNTTTLTSLPYQNQNVFFVESNSTVTSMAFNSTSSELSFTVNGTSGTKGYVRVTIAKRLMPNAQNLKVHLDGNQLNYTLEETTETWLITFSYSHSTHRLTISLPAESPSTNDSLNPDATPTNPATPTENTSPNPPSPSPTTIENASPATAESSQLAESPSPDTNHRITTSELGSWIIAAIILLTITCIAAAIAVNRTIQRRSKPDL